MTPADSRFILRQIKIAVAGPSHEYHREEVGKQRCRPNTRCDPESCEYRDRAARRRAKNKGESSLCRYAAKCMTLPISSAASRARIVLTHSTSVLRWGERFGNAKAIRADAGDIVWLQFSPQAGHEQAGHRPALVLSPASYNAKAGQMLCCPMTIRVRNYPFDVALDDK